MKRTFALIPLLCITLLPIPADASMLNGLRQLQRHTERCVQRSDAEAACWQQFIVVAGQILQLPEGLKAADADALSNAATRPGWQQKDRLLERMLMLGYTPHEIGEVIGGRISLSALQQAGRMRSVGYRRDEVQRYLERHYRQYVVDTSAASAEPPSIRQLAEGVIHRLARQHRIDPDLIRAIISAESSWRPRVISSAGAIGLMQLMPATAKMLGVDPTDPQQNIEGGVRYLAGLMRMFDGDMDAALIAYNAGPSHARKWRRGEAVLYGETRGYLQRVKENYRTRSF